MNQRWIKEISSSYYTLPFRTSRTLFTVGRGMFLGTGMDWAKGRSVRIDTMTLSRWADRHCGERMRGTMSGWNLTKKREDTTGGLPRGSHRIQVE
jgi:hypothetical protein